MLDYENLIALESEKEKYECQEYYELLEKFHFDEYLNNEDGSMPLFKKSRVKEFVEHFKGYEHLYKNNLYSITPTCYSSVEDLIQNEIDDSDYLPHYYSYKYFLEDLEKHNKVKEYKETLEKLQSIVYEIFNKHLCYEYNGGVSIEELLKEVVGKENDKVL